VKKWDSWLKSEGLKGDLLIIARKQKYKEDQNENEQIAVTAYWCIIRSIIGNIPLRDGMFSSSLCIANKIPHKIRVGGSLNWSVGSGNHSYASWYKTGF
jgi:hypothetical protein